VVDLKVDQQVLDVAVDVSGTGGEQREELLVDAVDLERR
jgi:hypothetical protein